MEDEQRNEAFKETFKAMMVLPVEGLKIIFWMNGGAAVAVLTYVGNHSDKSGIPLERIVDAILWYCAGLSAAAATFLVSYIVQLTLLESIYQKATLMGMKARHRPLVLLGCALSAFAVAAFICGSITAAKALGH